ncbi:predicted protein [Aspergillus terreus NIH2624]|uniref:Uncharacterized protein n=1 Tax=Aspergillus terreus (strain NIH 2624 / FGSC A1156) TaxID=341663 RepID=Q0CBN1_ASPTN|nr:uncharacterized protein ATEG_08903 [Aspergillus terreus NIH2624]EAU31035.1 predicted protein [Aspergillus terreus NIH2624]
MAYERAELEEEQCFAMLGEQFGVNPTDLKELVTVTLATLAYDNDMLMRVQQLREAYGASLRIFGIWKFARPNYQRLRDRWTDEFFSTFDAVFTSFDIGLLPPGLGFHRSVLASTTSSPRNAILLDKDVKNLTAAGLLGIRVVNLSLTKSLTQSIEIMLGEPLPRAVRFLQHNAKHLHPFTEDGTMLRENYLQLLILEATQDKTANFYQNEPTK